MNLYSKIYTASCLEVDDIDRTASLVGIKYVIVSWAFKQVRLDLAWSSGEESDFFFLPLGF